MLRKQKKVKLDKSHLESFKIRFVKNIDENPQKEETVMSKNNGVRKHGKK
jgi:hypothetical protein